MVHNFRKFTSPREIKDIDDGVTVIAGNNEEGKSTLFNAMRSAIFERHNMTGKPREAMFPSGSKVRVEVQLDFELGKKLYRLEKNFGQRPVAILKKPDDSILEGSAAEGELSKLLNFRVPNRESKHNDRGLLGFFWLEQGHNLYKLNLAETGREKLRTSLEREVGDVMGGSLGSKIIQAAKEKRNELLTVGGKPKKGGDLYNAEEENNKRAKEADKQAKKEEEYQQDIEGLEKVRQGLRQIQDGGDLEEAQRELNNAKDEQKKIEALRQQSENAEHEINRAEGELKITRNRWKQHQKLIDEVREYKTKIEGINKELDKHIQTDLDTQLKKAKSDLELATKNKKNAELQQALANIHKLEQDVSNLNKKLTEITKLNEQLQAAKAEQDSAKVNQQCFKNLKSISDEVDKLKGEISAAATHVQFLPIENQRVTNSKGNIAPNQQVEVSEKECFTLDGFGMIEIEPAVAGLANKQQSLANRTNELDAALAKIGVKNMEEAKSHFEAYQQARNKIEVVEIRISSSHNIDTLHSDYNRKKAMLESLRNDVGNIENTEIIDVDKAEQLMGSVAKEEDKAREALSVAQQKKHAQENYLRQCKGESLGITKILNEKKEELENARLENSDEKLVAEIKQCETQVDNKKKIKEDVDKKIAAANPDKIQLRIEKYRDTIKNIESRRAELEKNEIEIRTRLSTKGEDGVGESLQAARGAAEKAKENLERVKQEADAWELLVNTLNEAEREAKEMFVAPVLEHISPFLDLLFPGAKPIFNEENMEIKELQRDSKEEPFLNLSIGTREQLSILVRLALAVYLKEKGYPSMVILDDALVYADDDRFERMQLALRKAAKSVQIIILTCRSRDWKQSGFPIRDLANALRANE